MPLLQVDDQVRLHVEDFGSGAPVLLVPGWPLTLRFWEPQVAALVAAGHRVIGYDRRGFGRSDRPWGGYDQAAFTADLAAVVDGLGLTGVSLVGFGTGCAEALAYAATSTRVRRLVLGSPVLFPGPLAGDLHDAAARHRIPVLDEVLRRLFAVDGQDALDEQTRLYLLREACDGAPQATLGALGTWRDADPGPDLARVTVPVLVIAGGRDAFVDPDGGAERVARSIAGARLACVPDAPHGASVTHAEEWNRLLLAELRAGEHDPTVGSGAAEGIRRMT
ncbi:alpha/beta hydrolase [Nonomuraea sp. NPDC050310]|uniref:alpha/beta fold hydrolase n=1 Tax=unclassified Nonomuraea TaxID=2593643 RepID=UPI0033D9DDD5